MFEVADSSSRLSGKRKECGGRVVSSPIQPTTGSNAGVTMIFAGVRLRAIGASISAAVIPVMEAIESSFVISASTVPQSNHQRINGNCTATIKLCKPWKPCYEQKDGQLCLAVQSQAMET